METFSQLLNHYVQRLGLSDAELARTVGVSRQTIFRWREGLTGRPRHREDVLVIARKLRLTPAEQDKLLLAAGFRPEVAETQERSGDEGTAVELEGEAPAETPPSERPGGDQPYPSQKAADIPAAISGRPLPFSPWHSGWRLLLVIGGLVLLVAVITGLLVKPWLPYDQSRVTSTPTQVTPTDSQPANVAIPSAQDISAVTPALPGETMVLVTHFANYASSEVGYNVAGRLAEALQREVDNIRLENMRIAVWPEAVGERDLALQAGQAVSATLVIYGQYDVGRIVVAFAQPADQDEFVDPALLRHVLSVEELSATINADLPQQVRSLALMALGQIYLNRGEIDQARPLLVQARDNLQNDPTVEKKTWALANFYLGLAYHHSDPPDLAEAIAAYTQAVEAWPQMISSRLNRSAAYEARNQPGDLESALADIEAVIAARPEWALGYNNRASIRLHLGGTENLALALTDLNQALALEPALSEAYFNRAYVHYIQGASIETIKPDLTAALARRPDYGAALNMFCWGYAVEQQPDVALPYCQQAVAADPQPSFLDSRGLAYALLGDYPAAIADFQAYVTWLEQQPGEAWQQPLVLRRAWIDRLAAGQNPFTPQLLAELRREFGP